MVSSIVCTKESLLFQNDWAMWLDNVLCGVCCLMFDV